MKRCLLTGAAGFIGLSEATGTVRPVPHKDPAKRREYQRKYQAQWRKDNPERVREIQRASGQKRKHTPQRRATVLNERARRTVRLKVEVITMYGGKCVFCGEDRLEVLTIDHINGGGGQHRRELRGVYRGFYHYLKKTEFRPDLYRVLCANCHMALTYYGVSPDGNDYLTFDEWRTWSAIRERATT